MPSLIRSGVGAQYFQHPAVKLNSCSWFPYRGRPPRGRGCSSWSTPSLQTQKSPSRARSPPSPLLGRVWAGRALHPQQADLQRPGGVSLLVCCRPSPKRRRLARAPSLWARIRRGMLAGQHGHARSLIAAGHRPSFWLWRKNLRSSNTKNAELDLRLTPIIPNRGDGVRVISHFFIARGHRYRCGQFFYSSKRASWGLHFCNLIGNRLKWALRGAFGSRGISKYRY